MASVSGRTSPDAKICIAIVSARSLHVCSWHKAAERTFTTECPLLGSLRKRLNARPSVKSDVLTQTGHGQVQRRGQLRRCGGVLPHGVCGARNLVRAEMLIFLSPVAKVAVACALHDGLRARQLYVGVKTFGKREVLTADQQESKLRLAQLLVEMCVPTSSDIDLIDVLRFRAYAVIEGVISSLDFSHEVGASGRRISESRCAAATFGDSRRAPRCRQSVAQNHLILERLKAGLWKQRLMPAW